MQLLIMRHGIAETQSHDGRDANRRLTEQGVRKTERAARGLATLVEAPQVILSSTKQRAFETAQILQDVFASPVETHEALSAEAHEPIIELLQSRPETRVMIVGHEPTLSQLVERFCAGRRHQSFVHMKKAGCACLEMSFINGQPGPALLHWLASARMLRSLA